MTWGSQNTEDEAHEQLSYAFDYGINFMDTAEMCVCCPAPPPFSPDHVRAITPVA